MAPQKTPIIENPYDTPADVADYTEDYFHTIEAALKKLRLPEGVGEGWETSDGEKPNACSIAAINLALTGLVSDDVPACMDDYLGGWIIQVQDELDDKTRNSKEWRRLLPYAAGTAGDSASTKARQDAYNDYVWEVVLPLLVTPRVEQVGDPKFSALWKKVLKNHRLSPSDLVKFLDFAEDTVLVGFEDYVGDLGKKEKLRFVDGSVITVIVHEYALDGDKLKGKALKEARYGKTVVDDTPKTWAAVNPARLLEKMIVAGGYKHFAGIPELSA